MRLILANPRGFCAGVHMAVDVVGILLDACPDLPIYVYHEIVHNRHVVGRFVDKGATFIDDLNLVPEGAVVVFSAHGVSPAVRELAAQRRLIAIDATCPLVTKVHSEAIRYARQCFQILLIGHRNHQEVVGTMGEAPEATQVVESPADIPRLRIIDPARLVYLTQTTLSTDDAQVIIDALKRAFPLIKEPPGSDICYATTNRQHAVRQIAPECHLTLVIGSKNSSNSMRLTEISANAGTPAQLLDDASELRDEWFHSLPGAGRDATVLITAGASAPEDLVATLCRTLLTRFGGTIEQRDLIDEDMEFALPVGLKRLLRERGINPDDLRIRVGNYQITASAYGSAPGAAPVPLTVGGRSTT
jgi:4-hydroxy-3-methylbut-2-enyl diphosphate reductase